MENDNNNLEKSLNEYLHKAYVEPCEGLYELLSDKAQEVLGFWDVVRPKFRERAVNTMLIIAVGTFLYQSVQAQSNGENGNEIPLGASSSTPTNTRRPTATQVADPRCLAFNAQVNESLFVMWTLEVEGRGDWELYNESNGNVLVDQGRVSTGALAYNHQGEQATNYDLMVKFDGKDTLEKCGEYSVGSQATATSTGTATPQSTVTLQPVPTDLVTLTPTNTPDQGATATVATTRLTPIFITLTPTRTPTNTPTPNRLFLPLAPNEN